MKALVVDDDHVLADVITFTLRREGFQVTLAFDGETALLRWQEEQPDLVILRCGLNCPALIARAGWPKSPSNKLPLFRACRNGKPAAEAGLHPRFGWFDFPPPYRL
jgi:DNA-binding NarL/FixJ family response regulator